MIISRIGKRTKICLAILGALLLALHASAQSVSLNLSGVTVKQAITELKEKSGYSFVFISGDLDTQRIIHVRADNLKSAVEQIIADIERRQREN